MNDTESEVFEIELKFGTLKVDADIYYRIVKGEKPRPYHKYKRLKYFRCLSGRISCGINSKKRYTLSHLILPPTENKIIDHINRNPLDNRRVNLRIADVRQNGLNKISKNSSGYIGVSVYRKGKNGYCDASFKTKTGKRLRLCLVDTPKNRKICALMRDKFILQSGDEEYAPLNFPKLKNEPIKTIFLRRNFYEKRNKKR
jgi:hypothetical protein